MRIDWASVKKKRIVSALSPRCIICGGHDRNRVQAGFLDEKNGHRGRFSICIGRGCCEKIFGISFSEPDARAYRHMRDAGLMCEKCGAFMHNGVIWYDTLYSIRINNFKRGLCNFCIGRLAGEKTL